MVESVTLHAPALIYELVGRPLQPAMQVNYARLCFQYVGALALVTGGVDLADFRPERLADSEISALGQRLRVVVDENSDPNALSPQTIKVRLHNGHEYKQHPQSSRQNSRPRQQLEESFLRCGSTSFRLTCARCCYWSLT